MTDKKAAVALLLERAARWPQEAQQELAEAIIKIDEKHSTTYKLSDEERFAVHRGLLDMQEGRLASKEAVDARFDRYRG
jgi:hypothetical protein